MSNDRVSLSIEEIDARIATLRKDAKELLDKASKLEELRQLAIEFGDPEGNSQENKMGEADERFPYRGMGTKQAAIKFLRKIGEPQGATAIAKALIRGGKTTRSVMFHRTVNNTLEDASEKNGSELVK